MTTIEAVTGAAADTQPARTDREAAEAAVKRAQDIAWHTANYEEKYSAMPSILAGITGATSELIAATARIEQLFTEGARLGLAHTLAEINQEPDADQKEDIWQEAWDETKDAVDALLALPAPTWHAKEAAVRAYIKAEALLISNGWREMSVGEAIDVIEEQDITESARLTAAVALLLREEPGPPPPPPLGDLISEARDAMVAVIAAENADEAEPTRMVDGFLPSDETRAAWATEGRACTAVVNYPIRSVAEMGAVLDYVREATNDYETGPGLIIEGIEAARRFARLGGRHVPKPWSHPSEVKRLQLEAAAHATDEEVDEAGWRSAWDAFFAFEDEIASSPCVTYEDAVLKLHLYEIWTSEARQPSGAEALLRQATLFLKGVDDREVRAWLDAYLRQGGTAHLNKADRSVWLGCPVPSSTALDDLRRRAGLLPYPDGTTADAEDFQHAIRAEASRRFGPGDDNQQLGDFARCPEWHARHVAGREGEQ